MPPKEENKIVHQPSLQFEENQEPEIVEPSVESVQEIETAIEESMMPTLVVESIEEISIEPLVEVVDNAIEEPKVFFEISSGADHAPVIAVIKKDII